MLDPQYWVNIGGWAAFAIWNALVLKKSLDRNTEAVNNLAQIVFAKKCGTKK